MTPCITPGLTPGLTPQGALVIVTSHQSGVARYGMGRVERRLRNRNRRRTRAGGPGSAIIVSVIFPWDYLSCWPVTLCVNPRHVVS